MPRYEQHQSYLHYLPFDIENPEQTLTRRDKYPSRRILLSLRQ
jgi:hypothetical protein